MKKFILFCVLIMFCFLSYGQLNKTVKELRADSITERVTGSGVKIKNANVDGSTSTINDSTFQLYVSTHGGSASPAIVHDSLVNFQSLISNNNHVSFHDSYDSLNIIERKGTSNDTALLLTEDPLGLGSPVYSGWLRTNGLNTSLDIGAPSFIGFDTPFVDFNFNSTDIVFRYPTCAVTDGVPTDAEIDACFDEKDGMFIIFQDSSNGDVYLATRIGTWYYVLLTAAL